MDRQFKCDIVSLIEAVECNPCLWDKSIKQHKDIILRRNAWREVCRMVVPLFDDSGNDSQEEFITNIMNKWTHVRDSFIRSLRTKPGQRSKRKYVYAESLQFLLKNITSCESEASVLSIKDEDPESELGEESNASILNICNSKRRKTKLADKEILNSIQSISPDRKEQQIDEDHAFLLSLLPSLKKISYDDKMDFRIEVMQLISKYLKHNKHVT